MARPVDVACGKSTKGLALRTNKRQRGERGQTDYVPTRELEEGRVSRLSMCTF